MKNNEHKFPEKYKVWLQNTIEIECTNEVTILFCRHSIYLKYFTIINNYVIKNHIQKSLDTYHDFLTKIPRGE